MGTFARYTGKMDIPEEKRECFGRSRTASFKPSGIIE